MTPKKTAWTTFKMKSMGCLKVLIPVLLKIDQNWVHQLASIFSFISIYLVTKGRLFDSLILSP